MSERQAANFELQFKALVECGWRCHFVIEQEPENPRWLKGLRTLGVGISCQARPKGSFDLGNIRAIHKLCKETGCVVFHCENMHMSPLVGATLARVPVRIWQKHAMNSHYEQCREPGWRERLALQTRLSVALSTRVFAVSGAVASELLALGAPAGKVHVLHNPRPEFETSSTSREDEKRRLGFDKDDLVLLSLGRAIPVKGWDVLVAAFHAAVAGDPRLKLLLVGSVSRPEELHFAAKLREDLKKLGLQGRVVLTGFQEHLARFFRAADVFVMPSRSEGFCVALVEALAANLPCLASRVGIAADVIQDGWNGLLVERGNPQALACAIVAISDTELRSKIAVNAVVPSIIPNVVDYANGIASQYETLINTA